MRTKLMSVSTLALLASVSFPVASMADDPCLGNECVVIKNDSHVIASGFYVLTIDNDKGAYYYIDSSSSLTSSGNRVPGIYVKLYDDVDQDGAFGLITAINEGLIQTGIAGDTSLEMLHGMALGYTVGRESSPTTTGDVFVVNSGKIITRNASSHGIAIERHNKATGLVTVDNSKGHIQTSFSDEIDKQILSDGINIKGGKADLDINIGNIDILGRGNGATLITQGNVEALLDTGNKVSTYGDYSQGIIAMSASGDVTINIAGELNTKGNGSDGVQVSAVQFDAPAGTSNAVLNVLDGGKITVAGNQAAGLATIAGGSAKFSVNGNIKASGQDSYGVMALAMDTGASITIGSTGVIEGGYGEGSAISVGSIKVGAEVINNGELSALSDRLIAENDMIGSVGDFKVTNNGLMTGFVKLGSNGGNHFENTSKFISRNFSAQDADGIRNLRSVAVNDMGGDNSHVVNTASGVLSLGASSAEDFDVTGYYKARTGINNRLFSQDIYDFERKGLLQTQFTNTASFKNEGLIDLTGEQVGNTLVITSSSDAETIGSGTYVSGGTLKLGAELNDGDGGQGSKADMLIADRVEKGANATTIEVAVKSETNAALTKQNGIQLVQVRDKDHSAEGAFMLGGSNAYEHNNAMAIGQGAYAYKLYQNGLGDDKADGNWYLRSQVKDDEPGEELFTGGVPLYEAYPQFLLGLNSLPTLQQRVGNRYWNNAGNKLLAQGADVVETFAPAEEAGVHIEENAIWGRIEGAHTKIRSRETTSGTDYDYNTFKMQAGLDGLLHESEDGKLIGGITAHYTNGKAEVYSKHGKGDIKTDGYGLGATLTWYGENGFYVDNQAQLTWYDSDLNSSTAKKSMVKGNDGFGYTLSVETGKRSELDEHWSLTPQAQLQYSNVDFDSFVDPFKGHVSRKRGESLEGRLGLSLEHQDSWFNDEGRINRSYVYGIANLYSEFLNGTKVRVDDENFINKRERVWAGIGLGGSYNWNDDKYSVYGEGSVYTSLKHFGDSYSYKGTVGLRVKW